MMLTCEVNLKDRSPSSIQDAIAYACRHEELWRVKVSKQEQIEEIMSHTDLTNKCGSCQYYRPFLYGAQYGECLKGRKCGARTRRACKEYERKSE